MWKVMDSSNNIGVFQSIAWRKEDNLKEEEVISIDQLRLPYSSRTQILEDSI